MTQVDEAQGGDTHKDDAEEFGKKVRKHPVNCCVAARGAIPAHLTESGDDEHVD